MSITQIILHPVIEEPLTNLTEDVNLNVDLVITSFIIPSTAVIGVPFNISWTVTNQGTEATTIPSWEDRAYYSFDDIFGNDLYLGNPVAIDDAQGLPLAPGESYTVNATVELTDSLGAGDYYLFVEADSLDYQPETDNTNNFASAVITGTKSPVDLELTSVNAPSSAEPGDEIELSWTVTNIGTEATDASSWLDNVYLYTGNDTISLGELLVSTPITDVLGLLLDPGESYTVNTTVKLPDTITPGPYFFDSYYLRFYTDYGDNQAESSSFNNFASVPVTIPITPPDVDLVVISATAPPTIVSGESIELSWTVRNQGTVVTDPFGTDGIFLSTDETFDPSDSLVTYVYTNDYLPLESGESYTIDITDFSPVAGAGNYYLLFIADVFNGQFETDEDNNVKAIPITVTTPDVDLVVTSATAPPTIVSGEFIELSLTVTNQGTVTTNSSDSLGYDGVFLSTDETFDPSDSLVTYVYTNDYLPLESGESYTIDITNFSPVVDAGDYYLLFVADVFNYQAETDEDNNVKAIPITVTPPNVDLVVTSATAPPTILSGEPIDLSWTVTNQGSEITTNSFWYDGVYLSTDEMFDASDSYVTEVYTGDYLPLEPGESYTTSNPYSSSIIAEAGDYYLLFVTDVNNNQFETDEDNNVKAIPITVTTPDVDLVTSDVSTPTVGTAGSEIDLSWTVTNQGTNATTVPYWYDYVLFSTDTVYDFIFSPNPDIPVTLKGLLESDGNLPLAPGESYTVNQSGTIPNVAPGLYYLLFGNNAYNFQPDTNPENDVVVVPFSVVESTISGSSSSESLTGTDESESIEALEGRDQILANGGDDVIIGGTGGDTITGGAGADRFIYRILQDIGDTIVDFTVNEDKLDFSELLDSFSYQGSNPVTDGYLRWIQGSNGTSVQVDADGSTGSGIFRPFIFLENVATNDLTLSDFFI